MFMAVCPGLVHEYEVAGGPFAFRVTYSGVACFPILAQRSLDMHDLMGCVQGPHLWTGQDKRT